MTRVDPTNFGERSARIALFEGVHKIRSSANPGGCLISYPGSIGTTNGYVVRSRLTWRIARGRCIGGTRTR